MFAESYYLSHRDFGVFFFLFSLSNCLKEARASVVADHNSFSNSGSRLQLWCNPIIFTLLLFSVIAILLSWLKWFFFSPWSIPSVEHFCLCLYVLSWFIFSFHLLTLSLFKVSLFSFICLIPLTLASSPSKNKQGFKRLLFCIRMGVTASINKEEKLSATIPELGGYHPELIVGSSLLCTKQLFSRMWPVEYQQEDIYVEVVGLWVFSFPLHTLSYREMCHCCLQLVIFSIKVTISMNF